MNEIFTRTPVAIGAVARELGLSVSRVRQLADVGVFPFELTAGGHRRFDLGAVRAAWADREEPARPLRRRVPPPPTTAPLIDRTWPLAGLAEDEVWHEVRAVLDQSLDLGSSASSILGYAFTEMVNNAIDHSAGDAVHIRATLTGAAVLIDISDDGRGVFSHLRTMRALPTNTAAIAELTKGKVTTAHEGHSGEGIYFTSKAVDVFRLASDGLRWTVDNLRHDVAVGSVDVYSGTQVQFELNRDTDRDLGEVFRRFTDDTDFDRTAPVVKLFGIGVEFVSRSEAKRLASGLEQFTVVELDFSGVVAVGQGFVDELFRVWARDHPRTVLRPTNMNEGVKFMVRRGLPLATGPGAR